MYNKLFFLLFILSLSVMSSGCNTLSKQLSYLGVAPTTFPEVCDKSHKRGTDKYNECAYRLTTTGADKNAEYYVGMVFKEKKDYKQAIEHLKRSSKLGNALATRELTVVEKLTPEYKRKIRQIEENKRHHAQKSADPALSKSTSGNLLEPAFVKGHVNVHVHFRKPYEIVYDDKWTYMREIGPITETKKSSKVVRKIKNNQYGLSYATKRDPETRIELSCKKGAPGISSYLRVLAQKDQSGCVYSDRGCYLTDNLNHAFVLLKPTNPAHTVNDLPETKIVKAGEFFLKNYKNMNYDTEMELSIYNQVPFSTRATRKPTFLDYAGNTNMGDVYADIARRNKEYEKAKGEQKDKKFETLFQKSYRGNTMFKMIDHGKEKKKSGTINVIALHQLAHANEMTDDLIKIAESSPIAKGAIIKLTMVTNNQSTISDLKYRREKDDFLLYFDLQAFNKHVKNLKKQCNL